MNNPLNSTHKICRNLTKNPYDKAMTQLPIHVYQETYDASGLWMKLLSHFRKGCSPSLGSGPSLTDNTVWLLLAEVNFECCVREFTTLDRIPLDTSSFPTEPRPWAYMTSHPVLASASSDAVETLKLFASSEPISSHSFITKMTPALLLFKMIESLSRFEAGKLTWKDENNDLT